MFFRTRLAAQIIFGTAMLMAIICVVRSVVVRRELVVSATATAQTAADDVLWEFDLKQELLAARLARPETVAARGEFAVARTRAAWAALVAEVALQPSETLVLAAPSGKIIHAEGSVAARRAFLKEALTARAFVGDQGSQGMRAGLLSGGDDVLVAASIELTPRKRAERETAGARKAGGDRVRLALLSPLAAHTLLPRRNDLSIEMYAVDGQEMSDDLRGAIVDLWRTDGGLAELTSQGAREIRTLNDGAGRPVFVLDALADAEIGVVVPKSVLESLLWEGLVVLLAAAIALRFVNRNVVRPLEQLGGQAERLARTEQGRLSFISTENGPVGKLTRTLDTMLAELEVDRTRFVRNARIAGMSDVSRGVVHTAGSILESVSASAQLLMRALKSIEVGDLRAMVSELRENSANLETYLREDENGQFALPFLSAMAEALSEVHAHCLDELETVDRGVAHVVDLMRSQEKYAVGASTIEACDVTEIVEMALQVASMTIEGSDSIIIDRSFAKLTPVRIDRHRLTSVLINLFTNAIEAVLADGEHERLIEIATYPMDGERFVIEIEDTGVGIAPENLDLIFTSSFSTKAGAAGEGLYMTANLCRELGIAIGAVSQGVECGCTFKLRVPYEAQGEEEEPDGDPVTAVEPVSLVEPALAPLEGSGPVAGPIVTNGVFPPDRPTSIPLR